MKLTLEIKNFGKLEQATIQINYLTVLAGKNNCGKSFVSKALYSFLSAMNLNYVQENFLQKLEILLTLSEILAEQIPSSYLGKNDQEFIGTFQNSLLELKAMNMQVDFLGEQSIHKVKSIIELLNRYKNIEETKIRKFKLIKPLFNELEANLNTLKNLLDAPVEAMIEGLTTSFENSLKQNFQISKLKQLKKIDSAKPPSFSISELGNIAIENEHVRFELLQDGLRKIQNLSRVIYIESPIYWKLKSPLEWSERSLRRLKLDRQQHLTGIPQYFYDLVNLLRLQSTQSPKFSEILKDIKKEMGGQLKLTPDGNLVFQEQKAMHPISVTALGVANLGMLAMLLEKNLIDSGTFLFIDEPEAHLHPAWQVIFIKALYQLAKADVQIMIATHSVDILKYIEVLAKKDKQAESRIALNHLSVQGISDDNEMDFYQKLRKIKQELTEPFYELYLEGL
ncbi:MAG: AAA family ATPase [Pseudomonadota bacterium]|nr:AAA family ATPase [Pseudomonadota bacterium]